MTMLQVVNTASSIDSATLSATFFGLFISMMLSIIGFLLRNLMNEFKSMKEDVKKQSDEIHHVRIELARMDGRVKVAEQYMDNSKNEVSELYKQLHAIIKEAVKEAIEGIRYRIDVLEDAQKKK